MTLNNTEKGIIYTFIHDFIGLGLLNSHSRKWLDRRKLISPAFHFSILKQFIGEFW